MRSRPLNIVAIGGNALIDLGRPLSVDNQVAVAEAAVVPIATLVERGERIVIVHGNGPQVGFMAMRSHLARNELHEVPLDALVANTQGSLGYMIQRALREELARRGIEREVVSLVTEVEVDPTDFAFREPTKPIGAFLSREEAERLARERRWSIVEDAKRGWRRTVPSPAPVRVLQMKAIRALLSADAIVICGGGGGIPVVRGDDGRLHGIEGVIDKDRVSALLGVRLHARRLFLTTGVDRIYRDFLTDHPTPIERAHIAELEALLEEGQFPPGSMGPKVKAASRFLRKGGQEVVICRPAALLEAFEGRAGTHIVP